MTNLKFEIIFLILIVFLWSTNITLAKDNNGPDIKNTLLKLIIYLLAQAYNSTSLSSIIPESVFYPPQILPPLPENSNLKQQNIFPSSEPPTSSFPNLEIQPRPPKTNPFDEKINARPLWAGACYQNNFMDPNCQYGYVGRGDLARHPLQSIASDILANLTFKIREKTDLAQKIAEYLKDKIGDISQVNSTTATFSYKMGNANAISEVTFENCFKEQQSYGNQSNFSCWLKIKTTLEGNINVNLSKIYNEGNNSEDTALGSYKAFLDPIDNYYDFSVKFFKSQNSNDYIYDTSTLYLSAPYYLSSPIKFQGELKNLKFKLLIDGTESLARFFNEQKITSVFPFNSGVKIKKIRWDVFTNGYVNGLIDGSWNWSDIFSRPVTLNKLEFCPSICEISIREILDLEAEKNVTIEDKRQGPIKIYEEHYEKFSGTGSADPKSGAIFWQNVVVNKEDKRKWDRKIDFLMPNGSTFRWSYYNGDIYSGAVLKPFLNYSYVSSTIKKGLSFDEVYPISYPTSNPSYIITSKSATIDRKETNLNGSITREGIGTVNFTSPNSSFTIKGKYDSLSSLMEVIYPSSMRGQRIDPIDYLNPGERTANISSLFDSRGLYVHGFFTATYGNPTATVATTRPLKLLPKKIVVLWSYAKDDPVFTQELKLKIINFLQWLRSKKVTVLQFRTDSRNKMINAFKNIPDNSWVLNIGHGEPLRLKVGKEFIYYHELVSIIEEKNLRIDGFSGITCYFGRSSLGQNIIGSLGAAINEPFYQSLGRIVGFGTNPWHLSVADILGIFCSQ